ncbi:MAG: hypothetical protein PUF72_07765 [Clostridiales bacterium]|nr:hypothetical protein [Clostridiales bacterium]
MVKLKRIAAALISIALIVSVLPQAMAAEAAEFFKKSATEADVSAAYGNYGDFMGIIADSETVPELDFSINLKNDGTYDIWLDSTVGVFQGLTGYKMSGDTELIANNGTQYGADTSAGLYGVTTGWFKVDSRQLSAGENTLTITANGKDDYGRYVSLVRGVAVVPKYYNWDPTKSETPQLCADPVECFSASATEGDSNGAYGNYGDFMGIIAESETVPELDFSINLNAGGIYDIWLDSSVGYWKGYTGFKMNDDADWIANSGTQYGANTSTGLYGVETGWHKADTRMLSSGINILKVAANGKDGYGRYVSVVRGVAIVPRSYNWDPTKSATPQQCESAPATEYGFAYAKDYVLKSGDWVQSGVRETAMAIISGTEKEHSLTYEVNLANGGNYDLWIENVNNDWASYLTYSIDGGDYISASGVFVGDPTDSYLYGIKTQWQKNPTLNLTKGVHTITFKVNKYTDGRYLGAVNAIALSPSSWKWSPVKSDLPQKPEVKEYAWLEAEDFDVPDGSNFVGGNNDSASGKSYMKVDHTQVDSETNDVTYTFEVSKKAIFDIDILSTAPGVAYLAQPKFKIDDGEFAYMKDNAVCISDVIYNVSGVGTSWAAQGMRWYRIDRLSLTAGTHTITVRVDEPRSFGDLWFFAFDAVAVVPRTWNYTPKSTYAEPQIGDYVYIEANNGYTSNNAYTESNRVMQILADGSSEYPMPDSAPKLDFAFRLQNQNTYDIWVDSITRANYDTLLEYAIDDYSGSNYTASTAERYGKITASGIGYGQYETAWHKITTQELAAGGHIISLRAILDPKTNRYLSAINRVVVVPSSWNWTPVNDGNPYDASSLSLNITAVSDSVELTKGADADISFISNLGTESDADIFYEMQLEWNGEKVSSVIQRPSPLLVNRTAGTNYTDTIKITVPTYAPDGNYKIKLRVGENSEWITLAQATLGTAGDAALKTASVNSLSISGNSITAAVEANTAENAKARLEFYKDGALWAVRELGEISVSETAAEYKFNFDAPKIPAGSYTVKVGIQGFETNSVSAAYTVENGTVAKPLSNGSYYSKKTGTTHFWYVNQEGAMIWDGEPFVPMGGMFCSKFISSFNSDDISSNKSSLKADMNEVIEYLERRGIKDLYINAPLNAENLPAWQYLIDYLDENGFRYGIQPGLDVSNKYDGYYIGANVNAIKASADMNASEASVSVVQSQLGYPDEVQAKFYVISGGTVIQKGDAVCTMGETTISLKAENLVAASGSKTVYFLPYVKGASISVPNVFGEEKADTFAKINDLMGRLNFGDGFRLVVDPTHNEIAYSNQAEGFVPYNDEYAAGFAAWLEDKYQTVAALNEAWQITPAVQSFSEAAQMMPVSTDNGTTVLAKADTNDIYTYNSASGCLWDDCILYRESVLANYLTDTADTIKNVSDIPVVYKNVSYINPFFVNTKIQGGHDGIGAEAYGSFDSASTSSAIANIMCRQSAKTMWNIVTETNTDENMNKKAQSGIISYGDKKTMFEHFNSLYSAGAKGVYDFVFNNRDNTQWYAYSEKPEMYAWLGEYAASLNPEQIAKDSANEQIYAIYPAPNAQWNWNGTQVVHNKRTAVIPENDSDVYNNALLSNGAYVIGTNNLDVSADTIIINIKNAPLSKVYGKEIDNKLDSVAAEKNVMVMGLRYDLGQIPSIDKYYTNEFSTLNGDKVQILNPPAGAMTLAVADNGKVCAFKYGNLYVIANDNWKNHAEYLTGNALAASSAALNKAYYMQDGVVYAKPQTGSNSVTFKFNNYTNESVTGNVIIAINGCEEIIEVPVSITKGARNAEITQNISVNTANISSVNYYFWNSLGGMTPIVPKQ